MKLRNFLAVAALALMSPAEAQVTTTGAIPLASPAIGSAWVVANRGVYVHRFAATTTNVNGYLMAFDAPSAPADGPVTPVYCRPVAVNSSVSLVFTVPARFNNGLTLVFSSTGCYTKTASATAYFEASPR